jgi:hypothetical protein
VTVLVRHVQWLCFFFSQFCARLGLDVPNAASAKPCADIAAPAGGEAPTSAAPKPKPKFIVKLKEPAAPAAAASPASALAGLAAYSDSSSD